MKKAIKFLWYSFIILLISEIVFGLDFESVLPKNLRFSPIVNFLEDASFTIIPFLLLLVMATMIVLLVVQVIINKRNSNKVI